ncbi:hypothetical protein PC9H_011627 [Pleurotus ostreatus]|uniref:Fungal-type protein kinase domain-containing protein n=1 Tax=Pleurotus ostreatus TaxID=5322 RepID=A0A8H7DQR0_PLEOS|nr:uncharacterized protein PC9H_011627 [Pleurotus ostreatus]KAF7421107.1 hypothetical protein PC9H_011627 [Pleurotus ostreatus]KAJ8690627.1 hypothetical protein PTI98_012039 [Pleurotus ostreatus]
MFGAAPSSSPHCHYSSDEYSSDYYSDSSTETDAAWKADVALAKLLLCQPLSNVSIEDFVKNVYGFTDDDVDYINKSNVWTLHSGGLQEYNTVLSKDRPEEELYIPFKTIIDDLFKKFSDDGYKLDLNLVPPGDEQLDSTGAPWTPDGLFFFKSFNPKVDKLSWSLSKAFLEFAVTPQEQMNETEACVTVSAPDSAPSSTSSGSKRSSSDVLELEEQGPSKRFKQIARKESQATGYALAMMTFACRRWSTGLVITDKDVRVHYYDRIGTIVTKKFNFAEEPSKLAMLALALAKCDMAHAGFEPLISSGPRLGLPLSAPPSSMKDTVLRLPTCDSAGATFVKDLGQGLYSDFEITGDPLYVFRGVSGRGSHILPGHLVAAVKEEGTQTEQVAADDTDPIIPNHGGKNGNVATGTTKEAPSQVTMAAKLSWPLAVRPKLEAEVVQSLRESVPWIKPFLPKVHFAMVLKGRSIGLPGNLFRSMTTTHKLEQRYLTLMVADQYKHLWEVPTSEDFMPVYLDIVECHHAAMKFGKVLHRDISAGNVLWRSVPKSRCVGVLNDWDQASDIIPQGPLKYRTGTGPFMARDLLAGGSEPPTHLYRHDLESLFYLLVWAAVLYTLDKQQPFSSKPNASILRWTGTYANARQAKAAFLCDPLPVFEGIQPAFNLLRGRLYGLWGLFHKAHNNSVSLALRPRRRSHANVAPNAGRAVRNVDLVLPEGSDDGELPVVESSPHLESPTLVEPLPLDEIDFETLGGCLTFENFLAVLGEKPRPISAKYKHLATE